MSTATIFDTLAQHDAQLAQHDQTITQAAQPDVFDQLAAKDTPAKPTGPTIGPAPKASDIPTFGESWMTPEQRLTMPLAKVLIAAHDKLREVQNFTQEGRAEHPIQAQLGDIADTIEGFLFGGAQQAEHNIGTGKTGILTNPVTSSLLPGAEGEPAAASALRGAGNLIKRGVSGVKNLISGGKAAGEVAEEAPGLVKQIVKGREVAQEPAKAAVREAAGAGEEATLLQGNKTIVDDPLKNIAAQEKAAYAKQDEVAGFDVKETRKKLSDAEWKVKQPEIDDATRTRLTNTIQESRQSIAEAEGKLQQAGIDPKAADTLHQQRMAGQDFKKALIQAVSPDGESVNVDGLLNASKKLRFSKFGDRLEQFLGKDGAEAYMNKLQQAHDLGVHAVKMRWIAGSLPVIGATVGEGLRIAKGVVGAASQ